MTIRKRVSKRERREPLLVGITGGIGAGKSTVAAFYRKLGYPVLNADEIAREIVRPGSPALKEIRRAFGAEAMLPDGSLDRAWLRGKISQSPTLRKRLEAITHPRIQKRTRALAREARRAGARIVFYEAPLLFEAKSRNRVNCVICVHASEKTRLARVMARDGGSRLQAARLLRSQMPQKEKMRLSDYLIENKGSRKELCRQAKEILKTLLSLVP